MEFFPNPRHTLGPRFTFDHWLVGLTSGNVEWGLSSFRFENMWLSHPSFYKSSLSSWWNVRVDGRWKGFCFFGKLRSLKTTVKEWNLFVFGDLRM